MPHWKTQRIAFDITYDADSFEEPSAIKWPFEKIIRKGLDNEGIAITMEYGTNIQCKMDHFNRLKDENEVRELEKRNLEENVMGQ